MITWIFLSILSILAWHHFKRKCSGGGRRNLPPGPMAFPLIGSLHVFRDKNKRPYEVLTDLSKKYGKIFGLQLGSIYTVVLSDPTLIREALKRDEYTGRAPLYLTHGIMGGKGIICAEGPVWRNQRKCVIGWLRHLGMVKIACDKRLSLETRIMDHVNNAIQKISNLCTENGGELELDLMPVICHNLGNAINDILFGITYPEDNPTWKYLLNLQIEAIEHIGVAGAVNFLPFLRFLPKNRRIIKFILDGKEKTHRIYAEITRRVEDRLRANDYQLQDKTSILELFLKERHMRSADPSDPEFGDDQLNHVLADIFGAGLDTTMTTIRWTLLYVALDRRVQEKLHREFAEVLPSPNDCGGGGGGGVTMEYYESLAYLRACITEAQRIRSVVPIGLPHGTTGAADTDLAAFHIPPHSMVLPLQWAVHMNPDEWPEPDHYKPERFCNTSSASNSNSRQNFMPFQTGKRMCLGDDLAKMLLFLVTGNLLHRFTMRVCGDADDLLRGVDGFTLTPKPHKFRIGVVADNGN